MTTTTNHPPLAPSYLRMRGYAEGYALGWADADAEKPRRRSSNPLIKRGKAEHGPNFDLGYVDAWDDYHPRTDEPTSSGDVETSDDVAELSSLLRF